VLHSREGGDVIELGLSGAGTAAGESAGRRWRGVERSCKFSATIPLLVQPGFIPLELAKGKSGSGRPHSVNCGVIRRSGDADGVERFCRLEGG